MTSTILLFLYCPFHALLCDLRCNPSTHFNQPLSILLIVQILLCHIQSVFCKQPSISANSTYCFSGGFDRLVCGTLLSVPVGLVILEHIFLVDHLDDLPAALFCQSRHPHSVHHKVGLFQFVGRVE